MKVKELIEHLKTLDQERGIWVSYDCGYSVFAPIPDSYVDQYDLERFRENGSDEIEVNDYIILAG